MVIPPWMTLWSYFVFPHSIDLFPFIVYMVFPHRNSAAWSHLLGCVIFFWGCKKNCITSRPPCGPAGFMGVHMCRTFRGCILNKNKLSRLPTRGSHDLHRTGAFSFVQLMWFTSDRWAPEGKHLLNKTSFGLSSTLRGQTTPLPNGMLLILTY